MYKSNLLELNWTTFLWQERRGLKEETSTVIDPLTHRKLYRAFPLGNATGLFRNSINRTTQRQLFYFWQRQNLRFFFILNVSYSLSKSARLFAHFYRTLPIDRSNICPCTCPHFLFVRIPIFHPSFGLGGKKKEKFHATLTTSLPSLRY